MFSFTVTIQLLILFIVAGDGPLSLKAKYISIFALDQVSILGYPNAREGVIPELSKGLYINQIDISVKGTDSFFEGYEKLSYPFEQEARPALKPMGARSS